MYFACNKMIKQPQIKNVDFRCSNVGMTSVNLFSHVKITKIALTGL